MKCAGVGHRSIVEKLSAYNAKGPGFKTRWRQEFINIKLYVLFIWKNKAPIGAILKKKNEVGREIDCSQFTFNYLQSTMFFIIEYNAEL